jgi:uncharacterized protein with HEPN domain
LREKRTYVDYLRDMLAYAKAAERITAGSTFESFRGSEEKGLAVVRALEIIGEAARQVPIEIRQRYPDVPWAEAIGMRNKVIHGYFGVDLRVVWDTVQEDLPPLREAVTRMLEDTALE